MKVFWCLLTLVSLGALGQQPATSPDTLVNDARLEQLRDTLRSEEIQSLVKPDSSRKFFGTLAQVFGVKPYTEDEKPRVSFVRSLFLPGWGQITNRDYWKAGLIYGAAGAGWYFGIRANQLQYEKYLGHYSRATFLSRGQVFLSDTDFSTENVLAAASQLFISNNDKNDVFYARSSEGTYYTLTYRETTVDDQRLEYYLAEEAPVSDSEVIGAFNIQTFNSAKNQYRRWRDASYIGFAAGWLFFALEANVAAHLKTFDMSEDISLRIEPAGPQTFGFQASGVKLAFVFR